MAGRMISDVIPSAAQATFQDEAAPASVKFELYVKTHEIKQIGLSLEQIMLLPKKQRHAWVQDHETLVNEMLDNFLQDSALALDGLQLDGEAVQLSIEYVTALRDTMNTLRGILDEARSLAS